MSPGAVSLPEISLPSQAHSAIRDEWAKPWNPAVVGWGRRRSRDPPFGEKQRQYTTYACISVVNNPEYAKAGRLIEAKAEPVPGAIEPKATSIG